MIVYVETNFVLELALLQEQVASCDEILRICESGQAKLVIPAASIAEATATLDRRGNDRKKTKTDLDQELNQLARTSTYAQRLQGFREITSLLVESSVTEKARLTEVTERLLRVAEIVPLDREILTSAGTLQDLYDLRPPDALVLASVLSHLGDDPGIPSRFLNRDTDFADPKIIEELLKRRCKLVGHFEHGLAALRTEARSGA